MTIGVLAPYRSCGVGTEMLEQTLKDAEKDISLSEAYLHVQVGPKPYNSTPIQPPIQPPIISPRPNILRDTLWMFCPPSCTHAPCEIPEQVSYKDALSYTIHNPKFSTPNSKP